MSRSTLAMIRSYTRFWRPGMLNTGWGQGSFALAADLDSDDLAICLDGDGAKSFASGFGIG
jgi:hypothetical protein